MSVGFEPTSYQASEDPPLNGEVCAVIGNLMGDLECDLTVTFGAMSNSKSGMYNFSVDSPNLKCKSCIMIVFFLMALS